MASIAHHHFVAGESKVEIAERLGMSRFKVARLLEAAIECGIVRIDIAPSFGVDLAASASLKERLSLSHCAVLAVDSASPSTTLDALGRVAAQLLSEIMTARDVLGLPWSRAVYAMTRSLEELPPVRVVQLAGGVEIEGYEASAVDLVRTAARLGGGPSSIFHAPLILDDIETAAAVRRQHSVAAGLAAATDVTHAVVGIGAWSAGNSTVFDLAHERMRRDVESAGVVGEVAGVFFDEDGRPVDVAASRQLITVEGDQLQEIPEVLGIAYGASKADAVRAAVRGRLVTALVVDSTIARVLSQD